MLKSINKKVLAFLFAVGCSASAFAVPPGYFECRAECYATVGSITSPAGKECMKVCLINWEY